MLVQMPDQEQIDLFASGTIYRRWQSGQPVDFGYVLDVGVDAGQHEPRASRIIARLEKDGYRTFEDAKHGIENAGIDGIVVVDQPEFDEGRIDPNGYEEVAVVEVIYRRDTLLPMQSGVHPVLRLER